MHVAVRKVKINHQDFKPVQVRANGLVITSGGRLRKEYPLHTKDVKLEGSLSVATFVWITEKHTWLSDAVCGVTKYARLGGETVIGRPA